MVSRTSDQEEISPQIEPVGTYERFVPHSRVARREAGEDEGEGSEETVRMDVEIKMGATRPME